MRELLKGWRRKAGCVMLLMSLTITAVWLCHPTWPDAIPRRFQLACVPDGLKFTAEQWKTGLVLVTYTQALDDGSKSETIKLETRTTHLGVLFDVVVPFWHFILPLTLISAYLLIVKPRPLAPKMTEPAPTTGEGYARAASSGDSRPGPTSGDR